MSLSTDKRELIVEAKKRGETNKEIALWMNVTEKSVSNIWKLYRATGGILPKKPGGRPPRMSNEERDRMKEAVNQTPDISLNELIEKLSLPIKKSMVSRLLIRMGFSFKKNASSKKSAKGRSPAEAKRVARG
jgi:transposase